MNLPRKQFFILTERISVEFFGLTINLLAIVSSTLALFILGIIWYGFLFQKSWNAAHGWTKDQLQAIAHRSPLIMSLSIGANFILSAILDLLLSFGHITEISTVLLLSAGLWLAFPASIYAVLYAISGKPFKLFLIDAGESLLCIVTSCLILLLMR
jgi:Protein of unknown function (DUF1761)